MGGHSRFAPSSTEREYSCPASFLINEQLPDVQTFEAAEGTAAHHVGMLCLTNNHDTELYAGCNIAVTARGECRFMHELSPPLAADEMVFEVDEEMITHVQDYVDRCRQLPGDHFVEVRVEHTRWCPEKDEWGDKLGPQFGTSDHVACAPRVLVVTDLKYGKGVKVFAKENKQAIKYALGVWAEYDWIYEFEKVVIRIAQPRLDHFDEWEVSVEELLAWGEKIKKRLELVFVDNPPFGPAEKACKFCKNAARCKPMQDYIDETRAFSFDDETDAGKVGKLQLTDQELADAWHRIPLVKIRLEAIQLEVLRTMERGVEIPGLKLVESRAHRRWLDEDKVVEFLRTKGVASHSIYKRKLVSPNQAEKLLTKENREALGDLWYRPHGEPCIADAEDGRPLYAETRSQMFDDEEYDDGFGDT